MHSIAQLVVGGYKLGAPTQEAEEIDVQVAEGLTCRKCGGSMRYAGYHKNSGSYTEYVALAVCNSCGHETAF